MKFTGERYIPGESLGGEIEIEHLQRYHAITEIVKDKIVLDAASGAGYGTQIISRYATCVYGIDLSIESGLYAQEKFGSQNSKFICANITNLPIDSNSVDVVISFETIEHVEEDIQKDFLVEIKRVLKPDGILVISSPEKSIYSDLLNYKNEYHKKEFYENEFQEFLNQYFSNILFADQYISLAYVLSVKNSKKISVLDFDKKPPNKPKYLVAICSDSEANAGAQFAGNLVIDKEGLHQQKVQRVLDLQEENAEKNRVIDHAYSIVSERDQEINQLNAELAKLREIKCREEERKEEQAIILKKKEELLGAMHSSSVETKKMLLAEKERADELNRKLDHIYSTKAWRFVQKIYSLKGKIWPK